MEASGTGNMMFSLNGALTIGSLDGANVKIREELGEENFFPFGLNVTAVQALKSRGYAPRSWYDGNPRLREVIDPIATGTFSHGDRRLCQPLVEQLLSTDDYLLLTDYPDCQSYLDCQDRVSAVYRSKERWTEMSMLNVARMGKFSSDRAIRE